jgi:hypothetical protein
MATLSINGQSVNVDDGFLNLSPDAQNSAVEEIAKGLPAAQMPGPGTLQPAAPYDATDAAVHGLTLGLSDAGRAGAMAFGRYLRGDTPNFDYSQAAGEVNRGREAYSASSPVSNFAANLTGALAGPVGPAISAINAVSPLAKVGVGALTGGAIGGIQGAADNNTSVPNALSGAQNGAELGGVAGALPAAVGSVGRALAPSMSPAVQTLQAAGVQPTPGAASGGLAGTIENLISRIPILGTPINAARAQAQGQFQQAVAKNAENFNRGAVNEVLAPIGESLSPTTPIGNNAIAEMQQKVTNAYHAAIPGAGGAIDPQLQSDISNAVNNARLRLPQDRADQFANFVDSTIARRVQNPNPTTLAAGQIAPYGTLSGQALKDADTDLGKEAANYTSGNISPDERTLGNAYRDVQSTLRDWIARVTPANATALDNANQAWAKQLRVNNAAGRNMEGVFTPQNLAAAAKVYSSPAQYASGGALMQNFAQNAAQQTQALTSAGQQVLRAPNGVAGGHGAGIGLGVLGANLAEHFMQNPDPHSLIAAGLGYPALAALYSNTGRRAINSLNGLLPSPAPLGPATAGMLTQ